MEIPASDVDMSGRVAKCAVCNNVFSYIDQVSGPSERLHVRPPAGKPNNFKIERSAEGLVIIRRWFAPAIVALTFFCLFWDAFMVMWFYTAIRQKAYIMALFGSLHGTVGLVMSYFVIAGYFNRTYIRISYDSIIVSHKPMPWFGQKSISRQGLRQLYSKEKINYGRGGDTRLYSVQAIAKDGKIIELVSGLASSEEALFIEQEVERYLRLNDEPVRGEIPR